MERQGLSRRRDMLRQEIGQQGTHTVTTLKRKTAPKKRATLTGDPFNFSVSSALQLIHNL
jgi:hypothetical protein